MVNNRATPINDPLVQVIFLIPQSQKDYINSLGKSAGSGYIRKLISAQMGSNIHAVEIDKLIEHSKELEMQLLYNKQQVNAFNDSLEKQKLDEGKRARLINEASERIMKGQDYIEMDTHEFKKMFSTNISDINRLLGDDTDKVTDDEFNRAIIKTAQLKNIRVL